MINIPQNTFQHPTCLHTVQQIYLIISILCILLSSPFSLFYHHLHPLYSTIIYILCILPSSPSSVFYHYLPSSPSSVFYHHIHPLYSTVICILCILSLSPSSVFFYHLYPLYSTSNPSPFFSVSLTVSPPSVSPHCISSINVPLTVGPPSVSPLIRSISIIVTQN